WATRTAGATLALPFEVAADGRYALRLTAGTGPDYGSFDIEIDGARIDSADTRAPEAGEADLLLGTHVLARGSHTLTFRSSSAERIGTLAVETLRLLKLPPEGGRDVKTHHEAHFVRLGIGR